MLRLKISLVTALLCLLLAPTTSLGAEEHSAPPAVAPTPPSLPSSRNLIVRWAPEADRSERVEARADAEVGSKGELGDPDFQLVRAEPGQAPAEAIGALEASPAVLVAERDSLSAPMALPNDPLLDQLWGLRNLGLGVDGFSGAVAGDDIDAEGAWLRTVGDPAVVVADIDSGYRFEHPDLEHVAWTNPGEVGNGLDDDGNGIVDDLHGADFVGPSSEGTPATDGNPTDDDLLSGGHGVHTAGTIGAQGNNGVGITGVAQDIRIMPLRACARYASLDESRCPISSQIAAINYAGKKGARVANMSLGGTSYSQALVDALAANPQVLFVIAAGNDGADNDTDPHYPCDYEPRAEATQPAPGAIDNVVCVAATDQADGLAGFSDWGAESVDLGAPGTETLSTFPFVTPFADDFSGEDFEMTWPSTGADGGFERSEEAPLTSFGMTDSIGPPLAGTVRETTSAPIAVSANGGCKLNQTRRVVLAGGEQLRYSVLLNGSERAAATPVATPGPGLERRTIELPPEFNGGGSVQLRFRFTAGAAPAAESGAWIDDVSLVCSQAIGQASAYAFLQGTSMAAPHVSGAAALLFSLKPAATVSEVRDALLAGVDPAPSLAGKTTSGGRLDVARALGALDVTPPPAPQLTATLPASPADESRPRILGTAEAGAKIELFAGASCGGEAVAVGSAAALEGPGIAVAVADNSTSQFSATATDGAANVSSCSAPISYTEQTEPMTIVVPPPATELPPTIPSCLVPRLAGKTLGRAKAALVAAGCRVGKVTKPRPRRGRPQPALVVKSSAPGTGATAAGTVVALRLGPKPKLRRH